MHETIVEWKLSKKQDGAISKGFPIFPAKAEEALKFEMLPANYDNSIGWNGCCFECNIHTISVK